MNSGALSSASTAVSGSFDDVVVPHLGAGYRLACWLLRNEDEAEDVVQEASLRAFRYFRTFTGGNGRAWFLRIVRNTCCSWRGRRVHGDMDMFDEEQHSSEDTVCDPETLLVRRATAAAIDEALGHLPTRFRELIVLREMEGLTYREVADAMGIPMGTVMSGLSRARRALRSALDQHTALDKPSLPPSGGRPT
jgi:RNA polymerase sigma-70 factor (ECF subfamily)